MNNSKGAGGKGGMAYFLNAAMVLLVRVRWSEGGPRIRERRRG